MPTPTHPLDADAARVSAASWLRVLGPGQAGLATGSGWQTNRELLARLPEWVRQTDDWLIATYGNQVPASVAPTYVMGWYLHAVAHTWSYWLELCGRVPACGPDQLRLRMDGVVWPSATAVTSSAFYCLGGDSAATCPDALIVPSRAALVDRLREQVRTFADEFFTSFDPDVKIGSRQRQGMLADSLETTLIGAAEAAGDRLTGLDDAYVVAGPGNAGLRRSCCFAYKVSDELLCLRCPRRRR